MKLKRYDWNLQRDVEIEYPDGPIKAFIDWLNNTKSWHEDVELCHRRLRKMNAELEIARSGAKVMDDELPVVATEAVTLPAPTASVTTKPARKKRAKRVLTQAQLDGLARGRATAAANRAAKVAP